MGDPFNVIRIFNEKEVDEICVLDINASIENRKPDLGFISALADECFMPLSYGGGIDSLETAAPIFAKGVEKVVLGRAASDVSVIRSIADSFGSQAVTACVDCRQIDGAWRVVWDRGRQLSSTDPLSYARMLADAGSGEILLQNVDRDGSRLGYDEKLVSSVSAGVDVPVVALGGAGELAHLVKGLEAGASAVASGSAFVFIGRLRAVLINYPTARDVEDAVAVSGGS